MQNVQNKIIFALLIIIVAISIIGSAIFLNQNSSKHEAAPLPISDTSGGIEITESSSTTTEKLDNTGTTTEEAVPDVILYTGSEEPGRVVVIDIVKFAKSGYVVIYENTFEPTGEILGVSSFLGAGEYTNIPIVLNRDVKDGESFTAMIHEDNGDRSFDIKEDGVYRDKNGNSIFTQILIQKMI